MNYRGDIEGLRAVAIGLLLAAHTEVPGFSAGFVGVDIFFVISGYLVTAVLFEQRQSTGRIRLADFYARRFGRLLPALLTMLMGTAFLCWWALPPFAQMTQAISGAAAALWLSNFHFAHSEVDYFGPGAEPSVFLHTWSLGVEEQFYLLWPLVLTLVLWKQNPAASGSRRLLMGLSILAVVSFTVAVAATAADARSAYYMMPTRAWQFALGGLACLLASGGKGVATLPQRWAASAGAALLVLSMLVIDTSRPYPGAWALLPTAGAALLLWSGAQGAPDNGLQRVLQHGALQAIGRVSYGWYLWHWPLLMLAPLLLPVHGAGGHAWAIGTSFALAAFSYRWIERPARQWAASASMRQPRWVIGGAVLLMALAAVALFAWGEWASDRASGSDSPYRVKFPAFYAQACDSWYHSDTLHPCVFGNLDAKRTAYLVGDSIGVQWFPALEKILAAPDWRFVVLTKSSCPLVARSFYYPRLGRTFHECDVWRERALTRIAQDNPDLVLFGSTHNAPLDREAWLDGSREVLDRLTAASRHVVVLQSTPTLPFNGLFCADGKRQSMRQFNEQRDCISSRRDSRQAAVASWIVQAAEHRPNVRVLDMGDAVCPNGICRSVIDGRLVFRDNQHLDARFVESLTDQFRSALMVELEGRPQ